MVGKARKPSTKGPPIHIPRSNTARSNASVTEHSILGLQGIEPPVPIPTAPALESSTLEPLSETEEGSQVDEEEGEYSEDEGEYSDEEGEEMEDEPVTRSDLKKLMRHLTRSNEKDGKPVYTEEQEIQRLKLVRQIRNYFSDKELADIIKKDTHVSSSYRTLKKRSLLELEEDLITVEEAIQNANQIEPVTMVCNFAAPIIEKAMLASDLISSRLDVSGFADEFKADKSIRVALKMANCQIRNSLPGGWVGALAFSTGSLMYRVHVKNQSYDAVANFMTDHKSSDGGYQIPAGVPIPKAFYDPEKNIDRRDEYAEHIILDAKKRADEKKALRDMIGHVRTQKNRTAVANVSRPPSSTSLVPTRTSTDVPVPRVPVIGGGTNRQRVASPPGIIIEEHKSPGPIEEERKTPPPVSKITSVTVNYDYDLYADSPAPDKTASEKPVKKDKVKKEIKEWENKAKHKPPPKGDEK